MLERLSSLSHTAARDLRVRSGLNPMLWLSAIALPVCLVGAYSFRDRPVLQAVLVVVGILPIVVACCGFAYFALTHPEKLQSEDYQIRHEAIQMLYVKTDAITVTSASLETIATGILKQLDTGEKEKTV